MTGLGLKPPEIGPTSKAGFKNSEVSGITTLSVVYDIRSSLVPPYVEWCKGMWSGS